MFGRQVRAGYLPQMSGSQRSRLLGGFGMLFVRRPVRFAAAMPERQMRGAELRRLRNGRQQPPVRQTKRVLRVERRLRVGRAVFGRQMRGAELRCLRNDRQQPSVRQKDGLLHGGFRLRIGAEMRHRQQVRQKDVPRLRLL